MVASEAWARGEEVGERKAFAFPVSLSVLCIIDPVHCSFDGEKVIGDKLVRTEFVQHTH